MLKNLAIKRKLALINLITTGVAFLLIGAAMAFYESRESLELLEHNLDLQAKIIAANSTAAVAFNDPKTAGEILSGLKVSPNIRHGDIHTKSGALFAQYGDKDSEEVKEHLGRGRFVSADRIGVTQPIMLENEVIGAVFIESDLQELYAEMADRMAVVVVTLAGVFAIVWLLLSKLLKTITGPLLELAGVMRLITENKTYTARARNLGGDEIGALAAGFNDMLEQIQKRDEELDAHRKGLEQLVSQRTEQLENELRERKAAETALKKNAAILAEAQQVAHLGHWEWDVAANTLFWSDEVFRIFGLTPQQFGASYEAFLHAVHPDDRQQVDDQVRASLEQRHPYNIDHRIVQPDGAVRYVHEQGEASYDEAGRPARMLGTVQDITDRKLAEGEKERYSAELKRSNEDLQQFAYIASHDLQEPLRMISSYLQLIERRYKDKLDDDGHEFINFAVDGASRLQDMINGLLQFSRVETKGKPFEPTDCEIVLEQSLANLEMTIRDAGAVVIHDPLPTVMADISQLVPLFQNLIGNAIKYRKLDEPPRVHVSAAQSGNEWVFSVHDNGIGFDPKYSERIFGIFQRLHGREEYPGTGIGLAVCKRIVERHKGRIWVESEPGMGAIFYFTIPIESGKSS